MNSIFALGVTAGLMIGCCAIGFIFFQYVERNRGKLSKDSGNLSFKSHFRVVYSDKQCTIIEEMNVEKERFHLSSDLFFGESIRPNDTVRKVAKSEELDELEAGQRTSFMTNTEFKEIRSSGPFIKVTE